MGRITLFLLFVFTLGLAEPMIASDYSQQLLAQSPAALVQAATRSHDSISVSYLPADLDGSGQFQFLVAAYGLQDDQQGLYLRVFKQNVSGLLLVGEQEDTERHGGWGPRIRLVDINGDGIPEIVVEGHEANGEHVFHEYFTWTGSSLHSALEAIADVRLEDLDGDGVSELVAANTDGTYNIYKYDGRNFSLIQTGTTDPDGAVTADGTFHITKASLVDFRPDVFPLGEIAAAPGNQQSSAKLKLVVGGLKALNGKGIAVDKIDTSTLRLSARLRPLRTSIHPPSDEGVDASTGQVLEVEFERADLLRLLPKLKLTGPLASGDQLILQLLGTLKDGTCFSAVGSVRIGSNPR